MSSVSSINSNYFLEQLTAQQGTGSSQGTSEGGLSAKDAFEKLLQQSMAGSDQAQSTTQALSSTQGTSTTPQSSLSADMTALQQALSGGNISAAQQAFQAMQKDMETSAVGGAQQAHHHHHHSDDSGTQDSSTTAAATTGTQASTDATTATGTSVPATTSTADSQLLSLMMGMM